MGIPKLNKYLTERCTNKSIGKKHLSYLSNKILVIDTSIYMYKFISHGDLLEDMYLFISILLEYSIIPIFIFDGKPPPEKKSLLIKRNDDKKKAESEYNILYEQLQRDISDKEQEEKIKREMLLLKKKCIRLKDRDIRSVKNLMDAYGVTYFDAINEADELCAYLINNNIAYGCISDDMDMFMYGCKYIIRHLSLLNHTMIVYDYNEICNNLNLNDTDLKDILLLSGTDYDLSNHNNIYDVFNWHKEYSETEENALDFYNYVNKNKKELDIDNILNLKNMFICNNNYNDLYKDIIISNKNPNKNDIKTILEPIGFFWTN